MGIPKVLHPCQVCGRPAVFRLVIHPPSLYRRPAKVLRCSSHARVAGVRAFGWSFELLAGA
jgi:hypothetical protein